LFADGVEPSQELVASPCENQAPVLDAGDAEDAAPVENSFDLDEAVERAVERFEGRMAETGVEVIVRKVEPVDAADPELDILDLVLGGIVPCVCERLVCRIDSVDMCDRLARPNVMVPCPQPTSRRRKSSSRCGSRKSA
jgi:hypothetical protein